MLKTGPLHQLRGREGRARALLVHGDTAALCVKAMEVLVDAMGVSPGATAEDVAEALLPLLRAGGELYGVKPSRERHLKVVVLDIGTLLNDAGRRQL